MTRPRGWMLWLALAMVLAFFALVLAPEGGADSSTLSRQGGGWWALWSYAQARGLDVERLDRPLDQVYPEDMEASGASAESENLAGDGVLVLGFPWQVGQRLGESDAVQRHLRAGGTVLATYRLDQFTNLEPIWSSLGTEGQQNLRPSPPISPPSWWRYRNERWAITPTDELPRGPVLEIGAFFAAPAAPSSARVLYATGKEAEFSGTPLVWIHERLKGRVVVMPSDLLTNAELRKAANADFVETLFAHLEGPWRFDEYHHGLVDPAAQAASGGGKTYSWDLFLLHLGLVYLLGVWTLGRGFGTAWSEPPPHHGSASAFLLSLGTLHQKLGHHRAAAERLLERSLDYKPSRRKQPIDDVEDLRREAGTVAGAESLLRFARRLAGRP